MNVSELNTNDLLRQLIHGETDTPYADEVRREVAKRLQDRKRIIFAVYMKIYGNAEARPIMVDSLWMDEEDAKTRAKELAGAYRVMKWMVGS